MKIANGTVVALEYKLHLGDGDVIDASEPGSPLLHPGRGKHRSGPRAGARGARKGRHAAGDRPPRTATARTTQGVQDVPNDAFGGELPEVGNQYTARGPEGEVVPFVVRELKPGFVVVDLNHPLAGKTLHFDVAIREVREATDEEKEHRHVHGPGGQHHH